MVFGRGIYDVEIFFELCEAVLTECGRPDVLGLMACRVSLARFYLNQQEETSVKFIFSVGGITVTVIP